MGKWYAVMNDHIDDDWGAGSFDRTEAEKMVIRNLETHPNGYIAVIENDVCIEELEQDDFSPVYCYAARIIKAHDWDQASDDIWHLMNWLDMVEEWEHADGDTFEEVIRKAGQKIGVELA